MVYGVQPQYLPESESESKSLVGEESQLCLKLVMLPSYLGITNLTELVGRSVFLVKAVHWTVSSPGPEQWRSASPDTSLSSQSLLRRS